MVDLWKIWLAARTKRYHVVPGPFEQNVADHSWGVATLITILHPDPSAALLKTALLHDLGESRVGDLPATFKWDYPDTAEKHQIAEDGALLELLGFDLYRIYLSPEEKLWLKCCDMLELVIRSQYELRIGNNFARTPYENGVQWLENQPQIPIPVGVALKQIRYDAF